MDEDNPLKTVAPLMTEDLLQAFEEIQMARSPYILEHFVVGQHDTTEQRYAQCVLELQIKYDNIRRAILCREKLKIEQSRLERESVSLTELGKTEEAREKELDAQVKGIDVEEQDRAMLGALREFQALHAIFKTFPKKYTRADLDNGQVDYWQKRLTRQANLDLQAHGRIQVGNADALRMAGMSAAPELDHVAAVDQKYLEIADCKVLIVVPTEHKAVSGLPCLDGLIIPSGIQVKYLNVFGRKVADAYNYAVRELLTDNANFMLTVEDDTFPPPDALAKLLDYARKNRKTCWGAWYLKKQYFREGTPIVVKDGHRVPLDSDGLIHECYTLPMGCSLYPVEVFRQTVHPWFATTEHLTQDSFFSQLARDAGWKLMCDTSIKCRHIDRVTGKVYEHDNLMGVCVRTEKELVQPDGRKLILNVGCGARNENSLPAEFRGGGWREIRIDIDGTVEPDIVASMTNLGAVQADAIWSSHQLEHLAPHEVEPALRECHRVLKPGGRLMLETPNLRAVCEAIVNGCADKPLYVSPAGPIAPLDILYGHRASLALGREAMAHRTGFTSEALAEALRSSGFSSVSVECDGLSLKAVAVK
jgi:hypothetical protein